MFDSDLFYFPFLSSVWGSVSDWALIFVTAFTLYFLRKTLKSQLKVQELQQEINRIEVARFISDQKLDFDVTFIKPMITHNEENQAIYTIKVYIKALNGVFKNTKIDFTFLNGTLDEVHELSAFSSGLLIENTILSFKISGSMDKNEFAVVKNVLVLTIDYQDLTDYNFKKTASCRFDYTSWERNNNSRPIFLPEIN